MIRISLKNEENLDFEFLDSDGNSTVVVVQPTFQPFVPSRISSLNYF